MKFPREGYADEDINAWLTDEEIITLEAINCKDLNCHVSVGVVLAEEQRKQRPRNRKEQMARHPERFKEAQKHLKNYPTMSSLARYLFNAVVQLRKEAAGVLPRAD